MFNLEAELRTRFRDQRFCEAIRHPLIRVKRNQQAYEDVYDGSVYPNDTQYGQLHTLGSTDGIRVFKTTVEELWLVMMVVPQPNFRFPDYKKLNRLAGKHLEEDSSFPADSLHDVRVCLSKRAVQRQGPGRRL